MHDVALLQSENVRASVLLDELMSRTVQAIEKPPTLSTVETTVGDSSGNIPSMLLELLLTLNYMSC